MNVPAAVEAIRKVLDDVWAGTFADEAEVIEMLRTALADLGVEWAPPPDPTGYEILPEEVVE